MVRISKLAVIGGLLLLALGLVCLAEPVNPDMARTVAENYLEHTKFLWRMKPEQAPGAFLLGEDYTVVDVCALQTPDGKTLVYILDFSPGGFVAVSPDTDIQPVIAYAFEGDFGTDADSRNPILVDLLTWDLQSRLASLPIMPNYIKDENNALWTDYLVEDPLAIKMPSLGPWPDNGGYGWLGDTVWAQGGSYNDSCPEDPVTHGDSLVGCTAVAMGQIINYWQYPSWVAFAGSYDSSMNPDDGNGNRIIPITKSDADMVAIDYNDGNPSNTTIANLLFACGVSVEMNYSSAGSGAWPTTEAFTRSFRYESAEQMEGNENNFYDVLQHNMKDGRPAILCVDDTDALTSVFHTIVADGYKSSGEYHLNFGWATDNPDELTECWYNLPDMDLPPDVKGRVGFPGLWSATCHRPFSPTYSLCTPPFLQ